MLVLQKKWPYKSFKLNGKETMLKDNVLTHESQD